MVCADASDVCRIPTGGCRSRRSGFGLYLRAVGRDPRIKTSVSLTTPHSSSLRLEQNGAIRTKRSACGPRGDQRFCASTTELIQQFTCRLCAAAVSLLFGRIGRWNGREIARSALSLARSAQAERDNESCFFIKRGRLRLNLTKGGGSKNHQNRFTQLMDAPLSQFCLIFVFASQGWPTVTSIVLRRSSNTVSYAPRNAFKISRAAAIGSCNIQETSNRRVSRRRIKNSIWIRGLGVASTIKMIMPQRWQYNFV
ncbi:hypothetical protein EVAR_18343_1 [Eumeta japonica]|uniref:Uncharacterized protein n=1 Tax=Eumeta variegata TaxID=151549 RepID=A0A4C1V8L5_EUMVA|nr:hypothetical protein EVAR_18343_1 [Eumeta japonica]